LFGTKTIVNKSIPKVGQGLFDFIDRRNYSIYLFHFHTIINSLRKSRPRKYSYGEKIKKEAKTPSGGTRES